MKVFISYRRDDSRWPAREVYRALTAVLPREQVFMDIDAIRPGEDFVAVLEGWVQDCDILLALIGPGWSDAANPQTGERRLEDPLDFVRIEIREALRRGIPVVPLILDGAHVPDAARLPEDIRPLVRRQAEFIDHRTADADVERLIRKLNLAASDEAAATTPNAARPQTATRPSPGRAAPPPQPGFPVPTLVQIEPGALMMGSDPGEPGSESDEQPKHRVQIDYAFGIGKYAVTFDEYDAFCEATGRKKPSDEGWGRGRRPVINVDVADAEAYCGWLNDALGLGGAVGNRLPSEAEWEYATRAGSTGPFSFDGPISTDIANYDGNYTFDGSKKGVHRGKTVEVGSLPPNRWGLHEVHGNVWEWCADCWNDSYAGAPNDGSAWLTGDCEVAVLRGGSWLYRPQVLRSAFRDGDRRVVRYCSVGFRLARTLPSP